MFTKITTAVIAAAGQGTRMFPATKAVPKELFPVGKLPVLAHIVAEAADAGIQNVVIVAAPHNSGFIRTLFDPSVSVPAKLATDPTVKRFQESLVRCSIEIIEQSGNYGNGTPLRLAVERFGAQPCIYAFGDDLVIGENATAGLIRVYERTGHPVLGAQEVPPDRKSSFGILECESRNGDEFVRRVLEKPSCTETESNLASFGRYLVTPPALDMLLRVKPGRDGEVWFIDAIIGHLQNGGSACAFRPRRGMWYTVGDPRSYVDAVRAATEEQLT